MHYHADERACSSTLLRGNDLKLTNEAVERCLQKDSAAASEKPKENRTKYNEYTPEQRAEIGNYAAENGPTRASKHFSHMYTNVPEPTVRRLKGEYLKKLQDVRSRCSDRKATRYGLCAGVADLTTACGEGPLHLWPD